MDALRLEPPYEPSTTPTKYEHDDRSDVLILN